LATFLASTCLNDDSETIRIVQSVAPAQRENPILMNNFAFALAREGRLREAVEALNTVNTSALKEREIFTFSATQGLIRFRSGDRDEGRKLYCMAVRGFEKINEMRGAAHAAYFWAVEEKLAKSEQAKTQIDDAKKKIKRAGAFELEDAAKEL
jgi:hypothetical protein